MPGLMGRWHSKRPKKGSARKHRANPSAEGEVKPSSTRPLYFGEREINSGPIETEPFAKIPILYAAVSQFQSKERDA
jgi:hypothetical protein